MPKVNIRSESGGYLRHTIGFVTEIVEDREDHDTFAVTGGNLQHAETGAMCDWPDLDRHREARR